ncbi:MAG: hypothetical protein MI784_10700 [Cytophagales bacterium]|nr:hypothetical protein [Cytophagales bacterium]
MKKGKLFIALSIICLGLLFVFPLWKITLEAPQYPRGISLYIWISKIAGENQNTLKNINILNHYIGMKPIVPESIPEFKYLPYVIVGIMLIGIGCMFSKWRHIFLVFAALIIVFCIFGFVDFYLWEYNYGHNLDPHAPIKVPGMAYQPPLIGSKYLLNFKAISLPHVGGYGLGLAVLFSLLGYRYDLKEKKHA